MRRRPPLGLMKDEVKVVESEPGWAAVAERLGKALRAALGEDAVDVQHIGSTAVPGLAAKPIVDLAVALAPGVATEDVVGRLEGLGYEYRGDARNEGGLVFVLSDRPLQRIAHVHAVRADDDQWRRYLEVRDRLRTDRQAREDYADLKRSLALRFPHDRPAYTAAKTAFLSSLSPVPGPERLAGD